MAQLPADRTKLAQAQGNMTPTFTASSQKLKDALTEIYDTNDLLNQKVNDHGAAATLPHADKSVIRAKLADKVVGAGQLDDAAVGQSHHQDNGIPSRALPDNVILQRHMSDNSVGSAEIIAGAVTASKIPNGTINSQHIDAALLTASGQLATQAEFDKRAVNVQKYSNLVVGDDWTAAIQAAFDQGGTVFFPKGRYKVSRASFFEYNRCIKLYKQNNVVIYAHKDAEIFSEPDMTTNNFSMFSIMGCNNVQVVGLKFSAMVTGIPVDRKNCRLVEVTTDTDLVAVAQNELISADNISFFDNEFIINHSGYTDAEYPAMYGIHAHTPESGTARLVTGLKVINNTFKDSDGRLVQAYLCDDVLVEGNRFLNVGSVAHTVAIRMIGAPKNVRIVNNFIDLASGLPSYAQDCEGIRIGGSDTVLIPAEDVLVQNNIVSMKYRYNTRAPVGMYITWADNVNVIGNTFIGAQGSGDSLRGDGVRIEKLVGNSNSNIQIQSNSFINISSVPLYNFDNNLLNGVVMNNFFGLTTDSLDIVLDSYNVLKLSNNFYERRGSITSRASLEHEANGVLVTELWSFGLPTTGTFERGSVIRNTNAAGGAIAEWTCTTKGTLGTLAGVTANTTSGSNQITVNNASALKLNQFINITGAGSALQITKIQGTTVTLSSNASATVTGAAVSYSAPIFKASGQSEPLFSIAAAPSFIGQVAMIGNMTYIATGASAATDWKPVTFKKLSATIGTTETAVAHGLSYTPTNITITPKGNGVVWQSATAPNATSIFLTASVSTAVDIYVS